jgi:hypothetical protein
VAVSALPAAIELGKQGYSCFPCRADKRPACTHGCNDASTDEGDIRALWSEFPGPLIGVACGPPSQISVIDIDQKPEALEWWNACRSHLLPTRAHRTRSGGIHLIYGVLDGLKNSASKIAKGVDVRADGGYIIWWPAAGCPVLSDGPCAPFPSWLGWLVPRPEPVRPSATVIRINTPHERRSRLLGLVKTVLQAPEGNRNACLFWAACTVADMAAELADPEYAEAMEALHLAARDIGLPDREIRTTLKSAERRVR